MGRAMRWLKKLLTGRKEGQRHKAIEEKDTSSEAERKGRWSFAKHRKSGVDGSKRRPLSEPAAAEPSQARPSHSGEEEGDARAREEKAAVIIQKAFRGYLARKALRALRALVKLQALVRGYLVRKLAATTLHRLQVLMRLQADSCAVKRASYRKSMEQERTIVAQEARTKTPSTPAHRRGLSDGADSGYERSPRIVEMDTCHLRSRSTRVVGSRYAAPDPEHASDRLAPPCSSSPVSSRKQRLPRLSTGRSHEREPRHAKTAQNTPRGFFAYESSPAKSAGGGLTPRPSSHRPDALVSPRYMAGTASSTARTRCQSAPRQRHAEPAPRASQAPAAAGWRKSCSQKQQDSFCLQCSDDAARSGYSELSEEAARDYYLDRMW